MFIEPIPGSKRITERELALGRLSKPFYRGDYSVRRFLNQGDVVEFGVHNEKSDYNWEFFVNNDYSVKLWFSQLNRIYVKSEGNNMYASILMLKGKSKIYVPNLTPHEFWQNVRGRKFRVELDADSYAIDPWHPNCQGRTVKAILDDIFGLLNAGRYDDVKGMMKFEPLYSFIEV